MTEVFRPRVCDCKEINQAIQMDLDSFVKEEDDRYHRQVEALAQQVSDRFCKRGVVLLCGPSASGKTTTAQQLEQQLRQRGRAVYTVSLDNFYQGRGRAPRLADGSFDYESVKALDLSLLQTCISELITDGHTQLPIFDFHSGLPAAERQPLCIGEDSIVIFEGIHALNPALEQQLTGDHRFKVFINTRSTLYKGEGQLLSSRDIRLVRRLLRDLRVRNSSLENTFDMWRQVVRGEELYLLPYADTADALLDTTHAYEASLLGAELLPLLIDFPKQSPFSATAQRLVGALSEFTPLRGVSLAKDALLREFLGE